MVKLNSHQSKSFSMAANSGIEYWVVDDVLDVAGVCLSGGLLVEFCLSLIFVYGNEGGCLSCALVTGAGEGRLVSIMMTDLEASETGRVFMTLLM